MPYPQGEEIAVWVCSFFTNLWYLADTSAPRLEEVVLADRGGVSRAAASGALGWTLAFKDS